MLVYIVRGVVYTNRALAYKVRVLVYRDRGVVYKTGILVCKIRILVYINGEMVYRIRVLAYTDRGVVYKIRSLVYINRGVFYKIRILVYRIRELNCTDGVPDCKIGGLASIIRILAYITAGVKITNRVQAYTIRGLVIRIPEKKQKKSFLVFGARRMVNRKVWIKKAIGLKETVFPDRIRNLWIYKEQSRLGILTGSVCFGRSRKDNYLINCAKPV